MSKMRVTKGISAMNCIINVVGEVEGNEPCFVADIVMKQSNIRNPPSYRYVLWRCYCLESYSIMSDSRLNAWVVSDPGFGCKFMLHCNICLTVNSHIRLKKYALWYGQFGQNFNENKNCSCSHLVLLVLFSSYHKPPKSVVIPINYSLTSNCTMFGWWRSISNSLMHQNWEQIDCRVWNLHTFITYTEKKKCV